MLASRDETDDTDTILHSHRQGSMDLETKDRHVDCARSTANFYPVLVVARSEAKRSENGFRLSETWCHSVFPIQIMAQSERYIADRRCGDSAEICPVAVFVLIPKKITKYCMK